jgi:hypothetical protein
MQLNAGLTTQLLLTLFKVKGIVHWGIAGNANEDLQIGDVTIPEYWAHLSLWNWQRHGDGPENELSLEAAGHYTRELGALNFSDYTVVGGGKNGNTLNSIWYQPEERQHALPPPRQEARGDGAAGVRERDHLLTPRSEGGARHQGMQRQRVRRQRRLPPVHPLQVRVHPRRARGAPARRPVHRHPLALRPGRWWV